MISCPNAIRAIHRSVLPVMCWGALALSWVPGMAWAHGDETHEATVDSTESMPDTSALVQEFALALDSVYTSIAGTYYGIESILSRSCYDCHSDQTRYPWYYKLPLVQGLIDRDIEEARKHLDMSNGFPFGGHASQVAQLEAIKHEIVEGKMPLSKYRIMHWGTGVDDERRDSLFLWIDSSMAVLELFYEERGMDVPHGEVEPTSENNVHE